VTRLPAAGEPAPPFRLPTAAGGEVGLEDYRGRSKVVLWFSKGLF
jgi:peroxiredoxin